MINYLGVLQDPGLVASDGKGEWEREREREKKISLPQLKAQLGSHVSGMCGTQGNEVASMTSSCPCFPAQLTRGSSFWLEGLKDFLADQRFTAGGASFWPEGRRQRQSSSAQGRASRETALPDAVNANILGGGKCHGVCQGCSYYVLRLGR